MTDEFFDEQEVMVQPSSEEWEDYVMNQFLPTELVEGKYPTVNGLRRVCEKVLGPIVGGRVNVVSSPCSEHPIAVVEYELTIENDGLSRTFSSAADAHYGNTDNLYRQYLTAIAETRAEARALRKAMKIKVVSFDEISEVAKLDKDLATEVQMRAIDKALRRKGHNLEELAKEENLEIVNGKLVLSADEAKKLIVKLNKESK